jgi:hypothetical protein
VLAVEGIARGHCGATKSPGAHGATSVAFDTSIPGVDPTWRLDTSKPFNAGFGLSVDSPDWSTSTSVSTDQTMTPRRVPQPMLSPIDPQRALRAARR